MQLDAAVDEPNNWPSDTIDVIAASLITAPAVMRLPPPFQRALFTFPVPTSLSPASFEAWCAACDDALGKVEIRFDPSRPVRINVQIPEDLHAGVETALLPWWAVAVLARDGVLSANQPIRELSLFKSGAPGSLVVTIWGEAS